MIIHQQNNKQYRIPGNLNIFQRDIYIHLIEQKWAMGITEPGTYGGQKCDAIIPDPQAKDYPVLYRGLVDAFRNHMAKFPFREHKHFNHMASSQAANINLFFPILTSDKVNEILRQIRPDYHCIETAMLDSGYQIEFWDGKAGSNEKGLLGDHCQRSGTDSDLAIAYRNHRNELCLWLIEHKLTEREFTTCGACRSKGRKPKHDCRRSFADILNNKSICYYHDVRKFKYWDITEKHAGFFPGHHSHSECPFKSGTNQLWRNQLLALAMQNSGNSPYKHISISVVKHPGNTALDRTLDIYRTLIGNNPDFTVMTSDTVINACRRITDQELHRWANWYCSFYMLNQKT